MVQKIKFGVIGCSSIAKKSVIPAIINSKNTSLEMIGSRSKTKAKKFAKDFSCKKYGDYNEILENNEIDAIYISLPMIFHEEWSIKAAKFGKHVLCEKSSVLSYNSAKKVIKECKKNGVKIMENFVYKAHPQHKKISNLLAKNTIGPIHTFNGKYGFNLSLSKQNFRFNKKLGGGVLNDVGCYLISASRFIFQDLPISLFCNLKIDKKLKIDTQGNIVMVFPNNRTAIFSFGYENYFQSTYDIWATKGMIKAERAFNVPSKMHVPLKLFNNDKIKKIPVKSADQFQLTIDRFCNVLQKPSIRNDFEKDFLEQALIMDMARKSFIKNTVIQIKN
jgi:predicted dehydrogenase